MCGWDTVVCGWGETGLVVVLSTDKTRVVRAQVAMAEVFDGDHALGGVSGVLVAGEQVGGRGPLVEDLGVGNAASGHPGHLKSTIRLMVLSILRQ